MPNKRVPHPYEVSLRLVLREGERERFEELCQAEDRNMTQMVVHLIRREIRNQTVTQKENENAGP